MITNLVAATLTATLLITGTPSTANAGSAVSADWLAPTCKPRAVRLAVTNPFDTGTADFKIKITYVLKFAAYVRVKHRKVSVPANSTLVLRFKPRRSEAQVGAKVTYIYGGSLMLVSDSSSVASDC